MTRRSSSSEPACTWMWRSTARVHSRCMSSRCPRAEVLYSERPAKDATHIAQVIGRMVRSPLARRIATDDALNSVACFLPRFERAALGKITDELTRPGEPGQGSDVVVNSKLFERNATVAAKVFEL